MKIEIKNRYSSKIIFSHECELNDISTTLSKAVELKIDLSWADLMGANLRGANLRGAIGNMVEISSMQLEKYKVIFTKDMLFIGCKRFAIEEWRNFNDSEIISMDRGALEWWKKWKDFIFMAIELKFGK